MKKIDNLLQENADLKYKEFVSKLSPTQDTDSFVGVRLPILRKISSSLSKEEKEEFVSELPHKYFEEILIHRFILEKEKDYETTIVRLNELLPYLNDWALTDGFKSEPLEKNKEKLLKQIYIWLDDEKIYTKRFAIGLMMRYFLDDDFKIEYVEKINQIDPKGEYYLEMMIAWFFTTALCKHFTVVYSYFKYNKMKNDSIKKKTISKCRDSFLLDFGQKHDIKEL